MVGGEDEEFSLEHVRFELPIDIHVVIQNGLLDIRAWSSRVRLGLEKPSGADSVYRWF